MSDQPAPAIAGRTAEVEITTTATPAQAWSAWADPAHLARWFTDSAEGEAKPGATMTWLFQKFNYRLPYEVLEADPEKRLVLKAEVPGRPPGILDVSIAQEGGETRVRLVNSGFMEGAQWDDEYEGVLSGWQMAFAALKLYLEKYYGDSKSAALVMQPAAFEWERLKPLYTTAPGLERWIATEASLDGESARLQLTEAGSLSGRILAVTRREALYQWTERRGVLGLKAFTGGKGKKMICLHAMFWGDSKPEIPEFESWCAARLADLERAL